jgi:hypothetical protein
MSSAESTWTSGLRSAAVLWGDIQISMLKVSRQAENWHVIKEQGQWEKRGNEGTHRKCVES